MQVKAGYRQTDAGTIPNDWLATSVDECAIKVGSGVTPTGGSSRYKEYGRPFVRSQNVGWGSLRLDDLAYIDDETHGTFAASELRAGDVLLNITGASIGRSALADARLTGGNVNQHVCIIRTDQAKVSSRLVNYLLLSRLGQRQIDSFQAGGNREGLNFAQIRSIKFPLPPTKAEQEAIAEALSDADGLIESLEQLLAKKRHVKQGAMQQLLTGKKRLPGFSGGWEICRLGDLASFFSGGTPSTSVAEYYNGDIPWITSGDLNHRYISEVQGRISVRGLENSASKMIAANTLLIALYGATSGVTAISNIRAAINQAVLAIIPVKADSRFLFFKLSYLKDWLIGTYTQGGQPNLSGDIVKSIELSVPTLDEQVAVVAVLSEMDADIAALEAKLAKARMIKQGMMQELLTGRIRLV